jgi:(2R)-ethylmalonyl-CoA mutase
MEAKVVVGGIVPEDDARELKAQGVAAIYTPKDYSLAAIIDDLLSLIESSS